jgi:sec-independent protein translocase protein TatA
MGISWSHILIALMVFVLLFGSGKISGLMGDVAKGIKSLKKGLAEETEYAGEPESESTVFRDNNPPLKSVRQKLVQKSRTGL